MFAWLIMDIVICSWNSIAIAFCDMMKHTTIVKRGTASDKQRAEASKTKYSGKKQRRR